MSKLIIQARETPIIEQLDVKRLLPFRKKGMVDSFIFLDHAVPITENRLKPASSVMPPPKPLS